MSAAGIFVVVGLVAIALVSPIAAGVLAIAGVVLWRTS